MATPSEKSKLNIDIPADLKHDLKVFCVKNRSNMTDVVIDLIREYLHHQNNEKGAV